MQGAALVKQASPVASQQVNLYKRYEFCKQPEPVDGDEIVRELPEIRIEPRPLWRRDPELNLSAGICQKPQTRLFVLANQFAWLRLGQSWRDCGATMLHEGSRGMW